MSFCTLISQNNDLFNFHEIVKFREFDEISLFRVLKNLHFRENFTKIVQNHLNFRKITQIFLSSRNICTSYLVITDIRTISQLCTALDVKQLFRASKRFFIPSLTPVSRKGFMHACRHAYVCCAGGLVVLLHGNGRLDAKFFEFRQ